MNAPSARAARAGFHDGLLDRRGPRRRAVVALVLALASVGLMVLVCASGDPRRVVAGDGHYVFAAARSLAFDGDLDLTNQYIVMGDHWGLGRDPASDGWRLPPREIGASLLMVPGLWLHLGLGLGPAWEPAMACLLAAASLGLCWLACARAILGPVPDPSVRQAHAAEALAAGAVLAFVVPYYAWIAPGYNHAPDAAVGAWLCWALYTRRSGIVVGLLLACAVSLRMQNLLFVIWPVIEQLDENRRRPAREFAGLIGLALLGFGPQLWLGLAHPGSARGSLGWTLAFFNLDDYGRDLVRVLLGYHGLLRSTPIAALGLLGLGLAATGSAAEHPSRADSRPAARAALVVLAAFWLLFASVRDVEGGAAFGARRFAGSTGLLALGLGLLVHELEARWGSRASQLVAALVLSATALNGWRVYEAAAGLRSLDAPASAPDSPGARKSVPSQR